MWLKHVQFALLLLARALQLAASAALAIASAPKGRATDPCDRAGALFICVRVCLWAHSKNQAIEKP